MSGLFTIARRDGRSNQQVVLDLVQHAEPGTIFTYAEIIQALSVGTDRTFRISAVQGIVRSSARRLLREYQRALRTITGVGYKVAHANEHSQLSLIRKRRGDAQIKMGLLLLTEVRRDEMDPQVLKSHDAQLMIISGMYHNMQDFDRRLTRIEKAIRSASGGDAALTA